MVLAIIGGVVCAFVLGCVIGCSISYKSGYDHAFDEIEEQMRANRGGGRRVSRIRCDWNCWRDSVTDELFCPALHKWVGSCPLTGRDGDGEGDDDKQESEVEK